MTFNPNQERLRSNHSRSDNKTMILKHINNILNRIIGFANEKHFLNKKDRKTGESILNKKGPAGPILLFG